MSKRFLFSYALFTSSFLSFPLSAECIPSPDCISLGYDKTTCSDDEDIIRCPFDIMKVKCLANTSKTCETISKRTCGNICITPENCCSGNDCPLGQICDNYVCQHMVCEVGDIYYSDTTCSTDLASGKTPIGVVGYINNGGKNGLIVALQEKKGLPWGCSGTDTAVPNYRSMDAAKTDFNGKSNTEIIVSQCGSGTSAYYCSTYSAGGISGWYLPAYGELFEVLEPNHEIMDAAFQKAGGVIYSTSDWYRSSSEYDSRYGLVVWPEENYWDFAGGKNYTNRYFTRCVLAF